MSHIPAAAMPHARTHDKPTDHQPDGQRPAADLIAAKATSEHLEPTRAESGPKADRVVRATVERSPLAIAAIVLGGIAAIGGLVAVVLPLLSPDEKPKSRKRKRRKPA